MASTNKTALGLTQYTLDDIPDMSDTNDDNRIITEEFEKRPAAVEGVYPKASDSLTAATADYAKDTVADGPLDLRLKTDETSIQAVKTTADGSVQRPENHPAGELMAFDQNGNAQASGESVLSLTKGTRTNVACSCAYDAQANTFRLTKLYPNQETGDFFTVTFIPDRDYAAGAALSLDGETYHTRYENLPQDVAVESGEFRAGLCTFLNFQKFPGGGVLNLV